MGIVRDILGNVGLAAARRPRRSIADVERALARLGDERRDAREAVSAASRERDALLLVDDSDVKIGELDAVTDRHRLTLERCEKLEPILLEELAALRNEAKRAHWRRLFAEKYTPALADYAAKHRAALESFEILAAIREDAQRAGFASEAAHAMPFVGNILTREILGYVEHEADRVRDVAGEKPRKAAPPAPLKIAPSPAPKAPARRMLDLSAPTSPALQVQTCDRELLKIKGPVPAGHMAVRILAPRIELGGGRGFGWRGDEFALPNFQAIKLIERSCAAPLDPESVSAGPSEVAEVVAAPAAAAKTAATGPDAGEAA